MKVPKWFIHFLSVSLLPLWIFPIPLLGGFVWLEMMGDHVDWERSMVYKPVECIFLALFYWSIAIIVVQAYFAGTL